MLDSLTDASTEGVICELDATIAYNKIKKEHLDIGGREKPSSEREREVRFPPAQVRGKVFTGHLGSGHIPPKYYRAVTQRKYQREGEDTN